MIRGRAGRPDWLIKHPTLEMYRNVMSLEYFGRCRNAVNYLREFEAGLSGIEILLRLTEEFKGELAIDEYKTNKWELWGFYLAILDRLDRWEDWVATVESIRQNAEGRESLTEPHILHFASGGWNYASRMEATKSFFQHQIERREGLIKKKIELKTAGKSTKRYMHKNEPLTDEEYQRRKKSMKMWEEFARRQQEWAKQYFKERRDRREQQGEAGPRPGGVWVAISFNEKAMEEAIAKLIQEQAGKKLGEGGDKGSEGESTG